MTADQPVLFAEDDPLLREVIANVLGDAGFQVVTAENGRVACDALDQDGSRFCAIVIDVNLGDGPDGWAVAKRARDVDPLVPVIYVTGGSPQPWRTEGVPKSLMIVKPLAPTEVVRTLRVLLGRAASAG